MYKYEDYKKFAYTHEGLITVAKIMSKLEKSDQKVFTLEYIINGLGGSSFENMACVDTLVEHGALQKIAEGIATQWNCYIIKEV